MTTATRYAIPASKSIVMITGKDPLVERANGHTPYAISTARSARILGYTPHLFCLSRRSAVVATDYGIVHRVRSPLWNVPVWSHGNYRNPTAAAPIIAPTPVRAARSFLEEHPLVETVQSFGWWSYVGARLKTLMATNNRDIFVIGTAYTTTDHEARGKMQGTTKCYGRGYRFQSLLEQTWLRTVANHKEHKAWQGSDVILVNYDSVRNLLLASGVPCRRIIKLPYASDDAWLDHVTQCSMATRRQDRTPLIVTVSRHDPRKGLDHFLFALMRLRQQGLSFRAVMIGGGDLLAAHRKLVRQLGLESVVEITGRIGNPKKYFRRASIFVLPSLEEGSGSLALLEALQYGCAVVASGVDGIPEDVTHGEHALLVPPGDSHALSGALRTLLCDTRVRHGLQIAARERFEDRFRPDRQTEALARVYGRRHFSADRVGPPVT